MLITLGDQPKDSLLLVAGESFFRSLDDAEDSETTKVQKLRSAIRCFDLLFEGFFNKEVEGSRLVEDSSHIDYFQVETSAITAARAYFQAASLESTTERRSELFEKARLILEALSDQIEEENYISKFRLKLQAFIAKLKAKGTLSDEELTQEYVLCAKIASSGIYRQRHFAISLAYLFNKGGDVARAQELLESIKKIGLGLEVVFGKFSKEELSRGADLLTDPRFN